MLANGLIQRDTGGGPAGDNHIRVAQHRLTEAHAHLLEALRGAK